MDRKIKTNKIKCNYCGDIIVSENRHDFKFCSCGKVAVDGGTDYLKRSYTNSTDDFTELTEYIDWKCLTYVSHYDGNGRIGRIILFKECLRNHLVPFIIEDEKKAEYYQCLSYYQQCESIDKLLNFFRMESSEKSLSKET